MPDGLPPIHPGVFLCDEIRATATTVGSFSSKARMPAENIEAVIRGDRGIDELMAVNLGRVLGTTAEYWLRLQWIFDRRNARHGRGAPR